MELLLSVESQRARLCPPLRPTRAAKASERAWRQPCFLPDHDVLQLLVMSSPPAVKRRSISYTPDDDDEDGYGNGVRSGPSSPAPGAAAPVQGADASTVQDDEEEESDDEDELQDDDDDEEEGDGDGDGDGDNASRLYDGTMADTTMGDVTMGDANEDVKPSAASLSAGSAKKIKDYQTANARRSETPIPPDVNPGSANLYSTNTGEKL